MRVVLAEPNERYNLSEAEQFGRIEYISDKPMDPFKVPETIRKCKISLAAMRFNPNEDFICMTGNAITVTCLVCAAREMFSNFKLLTFDARSSSYRLQHYARNSNEKETV